MKVLPVTFTAQSTTTKTTKSQNKSDDLKKELETAGIKIPETTPLQDGMINAVCWFSFGFLLDRLLGKLVKSLKTPLKLSLLINGGIGLIAGGLAYIKSNKQKLSDTKK